MLMRTIDRSDAAWAAFERRDRSWDGRVIGAVTTTGIYCKPSCPARRPKRENVEFFADGEAARAAGYRACLRCRPDEVGRDREAVAQGGRADRAGRGAAAGWTSWRPRSAMRRTISSGCSRATWACRRRLMPGPSAPGAPKRISRRTRA